MQVHIHPLVTIYINTLLAWAKCFLATYGVYPGLYELLDTPRCDFLAAQLHLRDSTLPRPLLHRSRGPPTIRSEYVALQPHLAPPPTRSSVRLSHDQSVLQHVHLSCDPSIRHPDSTHSLSITPQVSRTVRPSHGQSVRHPHPSILRTIHPPSRHSVHDSSVRHPPLSLAQCLSARPTPSDRLYTILPRPSDCPTPSDPTSTTPTSPSDHPQPSYHLYDTPTSPSDHPQPSHHLYDNPTRPSDHPPPSHRLYDTPISPSACPSPADCLTATMTRPPVRPSFPTIHHTHDSNHSLAVMNGEQSHTIHRTQDSRQSLAVMKRPT